MKNLATVLYFDVLVDFSELFIYSLFVWLAQRLEGKVRTRILY